MAEPVELHADWEVSETFTLPDGTVIERDDTVELHSEQSGEIRGQQYRFKKHVVAPAGEWVDLYGGDKNPLGRQGFRSVTPDDIRLPKPKSKKRKKKEVK